jgi:hypothetical protein
MSIAISPAPRVGKTWTLDEARTAISDALAALPGWRIALHGSVLHMGAGRDLDLLVIPAPGACVDALLPAMGATAPITIRSDKRRFWTTSGQVVDARIAGSAL